MITAKIFVAGKTSVGDDQTQLQFGADYADGRNKEWAKYTPGLNLTMTVLNSVADRFEPGQAYMLTFTPEDAGGEPAGHVAEHAAKETAAE